MEKVLVTGGTGFLGRELLKLLWAKDHDSIRVLCTRTPRWLAVLGVEVIEGSILDPDACRRAVTGVSCIYHLAGLVSRDPADAHRMYEVHVEGTRALLAAAREALVRRITLCGTSGTIAVTEDGETIPDETNDRPMNVISRFPYYLSKAYQEDVAKQLCGSAMELVSVHPSLVLGPGDDRQSSTEDVQNLLDGRVPVIPPGGLSFVDVRDAADAMVAAMEKGRAGEKYLVGGPNWTFQRFFERLARIADVAPPRFKANATLLRAGASAADSVWRHFGRTPPVLKISAEMSTYFWYLDASKAARELGFAPRDPSETLTDTVRYLKEGTASRV